MRKAISRLHIGMCFLPVVFPLPGRKLAEIEQIHVREHTNNLTVQKFELLCLGISSGTV